MSEIVDNEFERYRAVEAPLSDKRPMVDGRDSSAPHLTLVEDYVPSHGISRDEYDATIQILKNLDVLPALIEYELPAYENLPKTNAAQIENHLAQTYEEQREPSLTASFPIRGLADLAMRYQRHYDSHKPHNSHFWDKLSLEQLNAGQRPMRLSLVIKDIQHPPAEPEQPKQHWLKSFITDTGHEGMKHTHNPADYPGVATKDRPQAEQDAAYEAEAAAAQAAGVELHLISPQEFVVMTAVRQEMGLPTDYNHGVTVRLPQFETQSSGPQTGLFRFLASDKIATLSYNGVLSIGHRHSSSNEAKPGLMRAAAIEFDRA